ncbi:hypothetical protein [Vibrio owensii]|nr:hypothetical protein [Vibrio owensii]
MDLEPPSEEDIQQAIATCTDGVSTNCLGCSACYVCPYLKESFAATETL